MRVINLCRGSGNGVDSACLMTASNMLIGKPEDLDRNSCVCPIISQFIIITNDHIPNALRNELYGPFVWEILGTVTNDVQVEKKRAGLFLSWAKKLVDKDKTFYNNAFSDDAMRLPAFNKINDMNGRRMAAEGYLKSATSYMNRTLYRDVAYDTALCIVNILYNTKEWSILPKILKKAIEIGDTRPVETVMTHDELAEKLCKTS